MRNARHWYTAALGLSLLAVIAATGGCAAQQPAAGVVAGSPLDVERCQAAGHEPGSASFAACLQTLDMLRRQEALREQQINNATINSQRRVPLPR